MKSEQLFETKYVMTVTDPLKLGACTAEVAFVGRSNVGKSSVLNALCHKKQLAHTSQTPGKTRAISVFSITHSYWLVDLPGYGFAVGPEEERKKWPAMIEGYLSSRTTLRMAFVLIDAVVGPTKLDMQMCTWLRYYSVPFCIVVNKTDKIKSGRQEARKQEIAQLIGIHWDDIAWVSASKNTGIKELRAKVVQVLYP